MHSQVKSARPPTPVALKAVPGLVAGGSRGQVAFRAACFTQFTDEVMAHLPHEEHADALAVLAALSDVLTGPQADGQ